MTSFVGVVLCAGYGTRLRPLTDERPKPAIPVFNRPMAAYPLEHLAEEGARALAVNTHHLADVLEAALEPIRRGLPPLFTRHEPVLLGTGGGVRGLWRHLDPSPEEDVVVVNGDILFRPRLSRAFAVHRATGAIATMIVRRAPSDQRGGAVGIASRPDWPLGGVEVKRLRGRPSSTPAPNETAMFTGVQLLSPRAYADLPEEGDIISAAYHRWLSAGELVAAVFDDGEFFELGTLADYLDVQLNRIRDGRLWPGGGPLVANDATIESTFSNCIVGSRSVIRASIEDAIVWDGAVVNAPARRAIVTPTIRVVP